MRIANPKKKKIKKHSVVTTETAFYTKSWGVKMNLDFSNCKTKKDVEKVFELNKDKLNTIKKLKQKINELV